MKDRSMKPESLMMSYGYKPELSEGAIKCPIFLTSTFVFKSAEEGKSYFELAYGKREKLPGEEMGLIYSRINNPDLEILENRLRLWDRAEDCAVFESGMSAISTVLLEFLKPGDLLLYSSPTYGGTDHFIHHFLPKIGVQTLGFTSEMDEADLEQAILSSGKAQQLAHVHLETPANPTNALIDIAMVRRVVDRIPTEEKVSIAVDNTYMGPLWQHPLDHGADLVLYSATKYIGGHSDLIAGAVLGNAELMLRVKTLRTFLGNMASPHTGWMLLRSLETLKIRMEAMQANAVLVADFLKQHPKVEKINYLGLLEQGSRDREIFERQCSGPGAMVSFHIRGGESEAFQFLNSLQLIKLAVSLGGTESLAEHPKSMTHAGVAEEHQEQMGVTDALVRLSIGVENHEDLIYDLSQALDTVKIREVTHQ
ncbi:cystathionine gamma-synthase family protein [Nonlabens xiamenensis]|uniref:cystathionine gamma-synthase family protein n=1 Tax=Nonlabens xiamenensis TaxID=2341043 RepID=UPI000F608FA4|nr:cystathionine gamma-synthase family protein [Nonlabens xiamenensis]